MDEITYMFIDGGYLAEVQRTLFQPVFGDALSLDWRLVMAVEDDYQESTVRRAFYYNCIDNIPRKNPDGSVAESPADLALRVKQQEDKFEQIEMVPGMQVREGYLVYQKKRGRVQKKVDVLLAVDMLNNAVRRNISRAILIAGDGDFVPVVEAIKEYGTYVVLYSEPKTTAPELRLKADEYHPINLDRLCRWSLRENRDGQLYRQTFPQTVYQRLHSHAALANDRGARIDRTGYVEREGSQYPVSEIKKPGQGETRMLVVVDWPNGVSAEYYFHDPDTLQKYVEANHGPITWNPPAWTKTT